jgi:hypothetical protein
MRRMVAVVGMVGMAAFARASGPLPSWSSLCQDELTPAGAGTVIGLAEKPIADLIQLARCAENRANAALGTEGPISESQAMEAETWLTRAGEALGIAVICATDPAGPLQASTNAAACAGSLRSAREHDEDARDRLDAERPNRRKIRKEIDRANADKARALLQLQGVIVAPTEGEQAYRVPDSSRPYETTAYSNEGSADRDLERFRGAKLDGSGGLRPRMRRPDQSRPPSAQKQAPKNHVLAFDAPAGNTNAFGFFNLDRELVGPFRYRFTAGNFEKAPKDDVYLDSTSFVGVEVDVIGSSPLEFFSIGTRYVVTAGPTRGVQVFANSRGASHGNRFVPDVQAVDVKVEFQGGTFRASVKPRGATDDQFVEFATYARGVADERWVGGMGGASFSGRRVLGIDDLFIEPIEP